MIHTRDTEEMTSHLNFVTTARYGNDQIEITVDRTMDHETISTKLITLGLS